MVRSDGWRAETLLSETEDDESEGLEIVRESISRLTEDEEPVDLAFPDENGLLLLDEADDELGRD